MRLLAVTGAVVVAPSLPISDCVPFFRIHVGAVEINSLFGMQLLDLASSSPNTNGPLDAEGHSSGWGASRRRPPAFNAMQPAAKQAPMDADIGESVGKCQWAPQ
jgi:hypothetical protein